MTGNAQSTGNASTAVPDIFLADCHLSAARAVLDREIGLANTRLAFVSGSLAAGLGHGMSDVDLYVAQFDGIPAARGYRQDDFIVQVNPVPAEQVARIADTCAGYGDTAARRPQTLMTDAELQPALRYAIGTTLVDQGSCLPAAADGILAVRKILMNRNAYWLSSFAEDALGALQTGDALTALQASLMVTEFALECALAGAGDVYLGRKFQLRRLARVPALRDVRSQAWAYLRQPDASADLGETAEFVIQRMLFASHLTSCALLDGWDKPLSGLPAFTDRRAEGGPVRSPWVTPVRFSDSWGMSGPDAGYRTTAAMIRLWHSLDGRPVEAVHQRFSDSGGADSSRTVIPPERLDAAITQLVENHAAVPDSGSIR
jgi:hypothetical protein